MPHPPGHHEELAFHLQLALQSTLTASSGMGAVRWKSDEQDQAVESQS